MADITNHRSALIARILDGEGRLSPAVRRSAFGDDRKTVPAHLQGLVEKVARNVWKVVDEDLAGPKSAGVTEDELFELTVCAAVGQASRQYESALAALERAVGEG